MAIKVTCQLKTYDEPAKPDIKVHAHWNSDRLVVLQLSDEHSVTVSANDLREAIKNATNVNRYGY